MVADEKAQIRELRDKFLKKLKDEGPPGGKDFHPVDIEKITSKDDWLQRFLEHNEFNIQDSLKMLWETCEWRRNVGANEINENNVRRDYLEAGVCCSYGKDKDGKKLFIINSKLHTKGSRDFSELQRCFIYWFERLERETNGDQISLFFNMIDAGLSNMDMELTKYLIGLFKNYYPNFLNYIIILEMPWVLNAAFNIIKSWLPAKAIPKIKSVKKSGLKEYVDPSIALKSWGGTSDYVFKFVPETSCNGILNGKLDNKKVHFAENSPLTEQSATDFGDQSKTGHAILSVEPEVLTFTKSDNDEISKTVTLKNNMTDRNLTYKIKTTAPEKFKVRPNTGILLPSQSITATIILRSGYDLRSLISNDRFLIVCLPIENKEFSSSELIDFWKNNGTAAEHHRLICRYGNESFDGSKSNSACTNDRSNDSYSLSQLFTKIDEMKEQQAQLRLQIRRVKMLIFIFALLVIAALLWFSNFLNNTIKDIVEKQSNNEELCDNKFTIRHDEI